MSERQVKRRSGTMVVAVILGLTVVTAAAVRFFRPDRVVADPRIPFAQAVIRNDMLDVAKPKVGLEIFKTCASCHSNREELDPNKSGPPLFGIVGAGMARRSNYEYSEALVKLRGGYWTTDELEKWIHFPAGYAPGTKMRYGGLLDPQERWDLISYLMTLK